MRKLILFALWLCAAVSLGPVSLAVADQAQTSGQQTATRETPHTGKQASGQKAQATQPPAIPAGFRPLSLNEGRAIVQDMAWADDEEGLAPDCSHLVHTLYEQAGHPYPYASSLDLYRGTGQFIRVRTPQPGDLIVWRGHVGIVVNPREQSFFSSVTSGAHLGNYRSAYWRSRGYARFYRYLTKSPLKGGGAASEAANRPLQPKEQGVIGTENRPSLQTMNGTPASTGKAAGKARGDGASSQAHNEVVAATVTRSENSSPTAPLQIPLRTGGHTPKAADVTAALEAANLEAGEVLRAGNLERLGRPIVVYRQLLVSGVELKGKRGTAQIQVEIVAAVTAERMESQLGWEDHQMELHHTKQGWVMTQGNEIAYVPRDGALRVLAARLAALTQSTDRSTEKDREQASIIRFLNLLVE